MKRLQPEHPWSLAKRRSVLAFGIFVTTATAYLLSNPGDTPRPTGNIVHACDEIGKDKLTVKSGQTGYDIYKAIDPTLSCPEGPILDSVADKNRDKGFFIGRSASYGEITIDVPKIAHEETDTTGATVGPSS